MTEKDTPLFDFSCHQLSSEPRSDVTQRQTRSFYNLERAWLNYISHINFFLQCIFNEYIKREQRLHGFLCETDLCCVLSLAVTVINAGESSMASKYSVSSSSSLASSFRDLSLPSSGHIHLWVHTDIPVKNSEFVFCSVQERQAYNHIPVVINRGIISLIVKLAVFLLGN